MKLFRSIPSTPLFFVVVLAWFATSCSYREQQPQQAPPVVTERVKPKMTIVVDAGHGDKDFGTHSKKLDYKEKNVNLATALMVRDHLQRLGYHVVMTRTKDVFIPLPERAAIANRINAALFVSIHYNSCPNPRVSGIEVYYCDTQNPARAEQSKKLAGMVLAKATQFTKANSRGVKPANFAVIRRTTMPAILVEGGYLTNQHERKQIRAPGYLDSLAWGIAKGVDDYLRSREGSIGRVK